MRTWLPHRIRPTLAAAVVALGGIVPLRAASNDRERERAVPIVDSRMTRSEALRGSRAPARILRAQRLVTVRYRSFDGRLHEGQIVIHRDLASDIVAIFREIERIGFPVARVVPIVRYGWSDARSMADNNTSGFNYRAKPRGGGLSKHAFGMAVDINPMQNPYIVGSTRLPPGARRDLRKAGTFAGGRIVAAFERRGWTWGGRYRRGKDWQHFSKSVRRQSGRSK
ncbi:MAG: M15 family metallopeptidase [Chthonomonadales bacterium]|nr:M15 family metallopeptidase [Chthonomonadales bacterium]